MSAVTLTIKNPSELAVVCTEVKCEKFDNLHKGTTIAAGGENTFNTDTSDRIFCTFKEEGAGIGAWQMGMTAPDSSPNNAYGTYNAGLQRYNKHGDLKLVYILGTPNHADWDDPSENHGSVVPYGSCS